MSSPTPFAWRTATDRTLDDLLQDAATPEFLRAPLRRWMTWQERNQTTVAQALRAAQLAPAWAANLVVLDAQVGDEAQSQPYAAALRRPRAWSWLAVPGPLPPHAADWVARAPTDDPIVYAAAALRVDAAGRLTHLRLALTGVSARPVFVPAGLEDFLGRPADEATWRAIARAVAEAVRPKDDFRGSAAYRRAMAEVLTRRALQAARVPASA